MGVTREGEEPASGAKLRSHANQELIILWGYGSWEMHIMEMELENVGVQFQIYANLKEDGMVIIKS